MPGDPEILILGCGYTGERLARLLLLRGSRVIATTRHPAHLDALARAGATVAPLDLTEPSAASRLAALAPAGCLVLHSIPTLPARLDETILDTLASRAARLVYLSTTGVYGSALQVDEHTVPDPRTSRARLRLDTEDAVRRGPWSWLILRPAAIYGPGRGIHVSLRDPSFRLPGDGSHFISRIHVDDLALHAAAALFSPLTGAFPVADAEPCRSSEIAGFCARLLGLPDPPSAPPEAVPESRRSNRRVDGSAIRGLLGLTLLYPSYRQGIPAALAAPLTR